MREELLQIADLADTGASRYTIASSLRALAERAPEGEPFGWVTEHTIRTWEKVRTERVVKITRDEQPSHGFVVPLYTAPPSQPVAKCCRDCGKALQFDAGEPATQTHPGQRECWYCADCGTEQGTTP